MKRNKEIIVLKGEFLMLFPVMFILPFYIVPEYSILRNTLSELGATLLQMLG